jgi:CheY-like chemotaxis protein
MQESMNIQSIIDTHDAPLPIKRILIVDDLKVNFLLIKALLQKSGFETVWAESGYGAIELIESGCFFDAVIMDYNMPEIDGLQATLVIKKIQPNMVVISHSTFTDTSSFDRSNAPFDDYLPKPIKSENLKEILRKYC